MTSSRKNKKSVLVTGVGELGAPTADALARQGARVVDTDASDRAASLLATRLSDAAALALTPQGIRVNRLHPGSLGFAPYNEPTPVAQAKLGLIPLGRAAEGEELGQAVAFLCGDECKFITGAGVSVDGGLSELGQYQQMWSAPE